MSYPRLKKWIIGKAESSWEMLVSQLLLQALGWCELWHQKDLNFYLWVHEQIIWAWVFTYYSRNRNTATYIQSYKVLDLQQTLSKLGCILMGLLPKSVLPTLTRGLKNVSSTGTRVVIIYLNLSLYVFTWSPAVLELCTCQQAFLGNQVFTKSICWLLYFKSYVM